MTGFDRVGLKLSKTSRRSLIGSGTAFLDYIRQRVVMMAFEQLELSPRELATRFTDTNSYYVLKSSVYRLLKAHDLIVSPAFIVIKAADEFRDKTTAPNQLWQTDFTYLQDHPLGLVLSLHHPR